MQNNHLEVEAMTEDAEEAVRVQTSSGTDANANPTMEFPPTLPAVRELCDEHEEGRLALRIKLRPGLKLCKLPGRFWASVDKVNYGVNYKFLPGHVQDHMPFFAISHQEIRKIPIE